MTLFQIEVFVKVVETGSFTNAGHILGLTQSGVSHNISVLETELGIPLLTRSRNGVSLTDAGERIIGHLRNILAEAEHIKQMTAAIQGMEIGKVKIGSFPSAAAKLLPGIVSFFKSLYPGIEVELYEGTYSDITHWITNGIVDIGFVSLPVHGLDVVPLMKDKLVALLPAGHSLHHNRSLHVEQIAEEPFIMPKAGCEVLVQDMFRAAGVKPKVHFEIEDNQTILAMVEEGIGWTIVPQLTIPKYFPVSTAELVPETYRHIGLAVKSMSKITPAVEQFITAAQKYVTANDTAHTSAIALE